MGLDNVVTHLINVRQPAYIINSPCFMLRLPLAKKHLKEKRIHLQGKL